MTNTNTDTPMHKPTTTHGFIFRALSSSESKYLMRPAAEWKPSPFLFFAIALAALIERFSI